MGVSVNVALDPEEEGVLLLQGLELVATELYSQAGKPFEMKMSRRKGAMGAAVDAGEPLLARLRKVRALIAKLREALGMPPVI